MTFLCRFLSQISPFHGLNAIFCAAPSCASPKEKLLENRCSETRFGQLKMERLYSQHFETIRQAKDETIDWLP